MHRRRFALTVGLILNVVAGSVGLSSCGGGSAIREVMTTPPSARAPDIVITPPETIAPPETTAPPENRAPQPVGSIPAQTLTRGGGTRRVDVARYFLDPDNDRLTYTAASDRTGVATARTSGSTVTLTPVSTGTATVTITASDGRADATQTIATRVRAPAPTSRPPPPPPEPEVVLTGIRFGWLSSNPRRGHFCVTPEPLGAPFAPGLSSEPGGAGRLRSSALLGQSICVWFNCAEDYTGDVTIRITAYNGKGLKIEKSASFTCR